MLGMEDVMCEMREDMNEQGLPPGFRFHPTDEELITYYLASKVFNGSFCGIHIAEVDLNRCEPWELPDVAKMGEREWYFFSLRDRKYPTGLRTNRATGAGYWKATGKDREVHMSGSGSESSGALLIGMKKTLVFYKGRAPRGHKTKWVMHEYRLHDHFSYRHTCKEEWVICRIVHKRGEKKNPLFQGQSCYLFEDSSSSSPTTGGSLPPLIESATSTTRGLQEYSHSTIFQAALQNPFLVDHHNQLHYYPDSDLKMLINPIGSFPPLNEGCFSPAPHSTTTTMPNNKGNNDTRSTNNNNNPSPSSILFNSLLSHQEVNNTTTTIPKQCKTEPEFSLYQLPHANSNLGCGWNHTITTNPLFFGMDCGVIMTMGFSSPAAPPHHSISTTTTGLPQMSPTAISTATTSMALNNSSGIPFQTNLLDRPPPPPPLPVRSSFTGELWPFDP